MSIFAKVAYYNKKQRTRARERAKAKGGYNKTARLCIRKIKTIWKRAGNMHSII